MLLRRDATYVTSAILPIRNVNLTSKPIARSMLILKAELFFADHNGLYQLASSYESRNFGKRQRASCQGFASLLQARYGSNGGYPGPPNRSRRRAEGLNISELSVRIEAARTFLTCQPLQLVAQRDEPHGLSGIFEKINDAPRRRFQMGGSAVRQELESFGRTAQMLL